jgi:hypothetical protein
MYFQITRFFIFCSILDKTMKDREKLVYTEVDKLIDAIKGIFREQGTFFISSIYQTQLAHLKNVPNLGHRRRSHQRNLLHLTNTLRPRPHNQLRREVGFACGVSEAEADVWCFVKGV